MASLRANSLLDPRPSRSHPCRPPHGSDRGTGRRSGLGRGHGRSGGGPTGGPFRCPHPLAHPRGLGGGHGQCGRGLCPRWQRTEQLADRPLGGLPPGAAAPGTGGPRPELGQLLWLSARHGGGDPAALGGSRTVAALVAGRAPPGGETTRSPCRVPRDRTGWRSLSPQSGSSGRWQRPR